MASSRAIAPPAATAPAPAPPTLPTLPPPPAVQAAPSAPTPVAVAAAVRANNAESPETPPSIRFNPSHQVLHGVASFTVVLTDPDGISAAPEFKLMYNGIDVSENFMRKATWRYSDDSRRELRLTTKFLRTPASREHRIFAAYRHARGRRKIIAQFGPPQCPAFSSSGPVYRVSGFRTQPEVLRSINAQADARNINPFYLAGLIAQESSFEPRTVSRSRALGLTQITSLGAAEIARVYPAWPHSSKTDALSALRLKLAVMNGEVNAKNEWRLDPSRSIQGGANYLNYLFEYWHKPEKQALISRYLGRHADNELGDIVLASYNSGAMRVSQAIERHGRSWLDDDELGEAQKYVKRVTSYCDYFGNRED